MKEGVGVATKTLVFLNRASLVQAQKNSAISVASPPSLARLLMSAQLPLEPHLLKPLP